ncbi:Exocyst complex component 2 [Caligus rogercresseyi]|uniref:Exocyst complex component 2 n=1 Tax=Caligus rogercresseyi TaxID=217165 RepID=A0A7T8HEU6_CALRO|nr:Exocyst complex component 2 [Caligus rogercresseyi]
MSDESLKKGPGPLEATAGTKLTIRGEHLGVSENDLLGVLILGSDCLMTVEWKSPNKLIALCPAGVEGKGEIIVATVSGGSAPAPVRPPAQEVAFWVEEKRAFRRRRRRLHENSDLLCSEDALGLSFPEETLLELFPGGGSVPCGDVSQENFHPLYFLLETHHSTNFEDLKAGMSFLRRKVAFIKSNISSIVDQLDTLASIRRCYMLDAKTGEPTQKATQAIASAKKEADRMTGGCHAERPQRHEPLQVHMAKGDTDRVIDEFDRAMNLYGDSDNEIFKRYLEEVERATLNTCKEEHLEHHAPPTHPSSAFLAPNLISSAAFSSSNKYHLQFLTESESGVPPKNVVFVEDIADRLTREFPDLWKLGQSYFKGDLVVAPDASKSPLFKDMILGCIRYVSNLSKKKVAASSTDCSGSEEDSHEYGDWTGLDYDKSAHWLPYCLRYARNCYAVFIELDLPSQALDILKRLTTDLRIQCLQTVFHSVIVQVHLLHEKEDWRLEMSDKHGCITELPEMFVRVVSESVQLIKEAILSADEKEENILNIKNAQGDLEQLIQTS